MAALRSNPTPWIAGTVLAFIGVAVARVVAPHLDHSQRIVATIGGQMLAFAGLFVICLGVRRRVKSGVAAGSAATGQPE